MTGVSRVEPAPVVTAAALADDEVHVLRLHCAGRADARRALRDVLAAYLETAPEALRIGAGPHGKPELPGHELRFNLSHSGEVALVALARGREVGVDVERIDRRRDVMALAPRALGHEGVRAVAAAPPAERPAVFHRAWARREAVAKCAGTGLAQPPPPAPRQVCELDVGEGYAAAIAVEGPAPMRVTVRS